MLRSETGQNQLTLIPFVDAGGAKFNERSTPDLENFASVGLGLRWQPDPRLRAEVFYGHALDDVPNERDDIQGDGFHFTLTATLD